MRKLKYSRWVNELASHSVESWLIIFLMILALLARLIPGPRTIDDAFITFRYARNIVHGMGFVYNAGEHVLGTTTPLYTLWMAALSLVTHTENYPILALVTNALADAVSTYLLYHLGRRLSNSPLVGLAAALLWAIAPMSVTFAIGGMETSVFILLMLATFTAHLERRPYLTAVLAALSFLTRPDAVLIVALVFGQLLWENVKSQISDLKHPSKAASSLLKFGIWRLMFVFLLVIAPWTVFSTAYFGSPIPQSVSAKSLGYLLPPEAGLGRLIQHFSVPFFESDVLDLSGLIRLVIYLTLYLAATLAAFRRDSRSLPLLAYPALYAAAFAIGNPLIFRWYLAPPLPAYMLGILLGVYQISNLKSQTSKVICQLLFDICHFLGCLPGVDASRLGGHTGPRYAECGASPWDADRSRGQSARPGAGACTAAGRRVPGRGRPGRQCRGGLRVAAVSRPGQHLAAPQLAGRSGPPRAAPGAGR
jgi:hypothetical protein